MSEITGKFKKTVCVDLDGVLAKYDGWKGVDHIGEPIPGAVEFLYAISQKYCVVIYTTRCSVGPSDRAEVLKANPHITDDKELIATLVNKVAVWLNKHGFSYNEIYAGQGKPLCAAFIDDRAISCRPQDNGIDDFREVLWKLDNMK